MKAFLLFCCIISGISQHTFSQKATCAKFKLIELAALLKINSNDFDTQVSGRCYEYKEAEDNELVNRKKYSWAKDNAATTDNINYAITKSSGKVFITYNTYSPEKYQSFKTELKKMKFTFLSEQTPEKEVTHFKYTNGKYNLLIILNANPGKYKYSFSIEESQKTEK